MANWITAILTFFMMIATVALAIIAWQAKNTWKKETSIKRKAEFAENLIHKLKEFGASIIYKQIRFSKNNKEALSIIYKHSEVILNADFTFNDVFGDEIEEFDCFHEVLGKLTIALYDPYSEDHLEQHFIDTLESIDMEELKRKEEAIETYCKEYIKKLYEEK